MDSKVKVLIVVGVWVCLAIVAGMGYKWVFKPIKEKESVAAKEKEKETIIGATSTDSRHKYTINFAIDSFNGYSVFRSDKFRRQLSSRGIGLNLVDDKADYAKRISFLQSSAIQMGVFTIDSLVKASVELGDNPATIIAIIDQSKGADAIIAHKSISNIDALNKADMQFVLTADSPSEMLTRIVMASFNLDQVSSKSIVRVDGVKQVYDSYLESKSGEKKAFVLWEPYLSKVLSSNPDYHTIIDSSRFRDYIVDVLVVSRDFLLKNPRVVKDFVEAYFETNYGLSNKSDLVFEDSSLVGEPLSKEDAVKTANKIEWANTQENFAYFGIQGQGYQHIEDMIANIISLQIKTKAFKECKYKPSTFFFDKILQVMAEEKFHPGNENTRNSTDFKSLIDDEWKKLIPVGALQVPRLVFSRGTSNLTSQSEAVLLDLHKELKQWTNYYLIVYGHCAKEGDVTANQILAKERAQSAVDWLIKSGVDKNRIRAEVSQPNGSTTVAFVLGQLPY
jgi:flagellar motor protein MotB